MLFDFVGVSTEFLGKNYWYLTAQFKQLNLFLRNQQLMTQQRGLYNIIYNTRIIRKKDLSMIFYWWFGGSKNNFLSR